MKIIDNCCFGGERPLFASEDIRLENVVIEPGESALKACKNIEAVNCEFQGKYPFWHVDGFLIQNCVFKPGARAALWYSSNCLMKDTIVEAPKMFREMTNVTIENSEFPDAQETLWHCKNVSLNNVKINNADYLFMHGANIDIINYEQHGNYSFQYCKNVTIRDAVIYSKDAFWNTENVTVYNSELHGEYLGWHSKNLKLKNCKISGTQPLCYCDNLIMENCTIEPDGDLAFEDSTLYAEIVSDVTSIKNPISGLIKVASVGELIIDENIKQPADCRIEIKNG